ncbi:MAG: hypothetical protein RLY86_1673 [Pseudomonadota bacterium]|jgi:hypothetical protein
MLGFDNRQRMYDIDAALSPAHFSHDSLCRAGVR